jgi:uncharacterized protein YggE
MLRTFLYLGTIASVTIFLNHRLHAAEGIAVNGTAEVSGTAQYLVMSMVLQVQGDDFAAALESLQAKQKQATIKLERLEAEESSIELSPVKMKDGSNPQQARMMQMMRQQMGNDPRIAEIMKMQQKVTLTSTITARWKLSGEGNDLLANCVNIQKQINDADMGGKKSGEDEVSPEEAELMEEMSSMMPYMEEDGTATPGTPSFHYLRAFSADERTKALAEAFKDAARQAKTLALAAEVPLGPLESIQSLEGVLSPMHAYEMAYGRASGPQPPAKPNAEGVLEMPGDDPLKISTTVNIQATFGLSAPSAAD